MAISTTFPVSSSMLKPVPLSKQDIFPSGKWESFGEITGNGTGGNITFTIHLKPANVDTNNHYVLTSIIFGTSDTTANTLRLLVPNLSFPWTVLTTSHAPIGGWILQSHGTGMSITPRDLITNPIVLGRPTKSGGSLTLTLTTNVNTIVNYFRLRGFYYFQPPLLFGWNTPTW